MDNDDNRHKRPASLISLLKLRLIQVERGYLAKIRENKDGWLARYSHTQLFSLQSGSLCRGLAIGMFWAFIPMPFQMVPATLFCLISYANLPIALLCVWVSNPLTYAPILYFEYQLGVYFFTESDGMLSFESFRAGYKEAGAALSGVFLLTLKGGLLLATLAGCFFYFVGFPLSYFLVNYGKKKKSSDAR